MRQVRPACVMLKDCVYWPRLQCWGVHCSLDVAQGLVKAVADTLWYLVTILWLNLKFPDESLAKCYETLRSRTPLINVNICTIVQAMFITS